MHRTIEISVSPAADNRFIEQLATLDAVISLSVNRGASIKPPGDVLRVHTLNRGADEVLKVVAGMEHKGDVSVATAEVASFIDPKHQHAVDRDVDEALWEEMETGLRHQGRITHNYLTLMALGGALAAMGLLTTGVTQAISFIAAPLIAPGFEPLSKIALGFTLRRWSTLWRGLKSSVAGHTVLIVAAALTFLALRALGAVTPEAFLGNHEVEKIIHPDTFDFAYSAIGVLAGAAMLAAYCRSTIGGALMALEIIHATAMVGVALGVGRWDYLLEGLARSGIDVVLILGLSSLVIWLKQVLVHKRRPLV